MFPHVNPDLQGSLSSPVQRSQPALLPGSGWPPCGPRADIYLRTTRHHAQTPSEISLPGVVVSPSPSSSSSLSSAESNIGLFGVCRVQGMLSFSGNSASQACCLFWPFSEDAAAGIIGEVLLLLSTTQGSQVQRGVEFRRHELSS